MEISKQESKIRKNVEMITLNKFSIHCCSDNCNENNCLYKKSCDEIFEEYYDANGKNSIMDIEFLYEKLKIAERKKKLSKLLS